MNVSTVTNTHTFAIANFIKNIKHFDISDANGYFDEIENACADALNEAQAMGRSELAEAIAEHANNYSMDDYDSVEYYIAGTARNLIVALIPDPYAFGESWTVVFSK